MKRVPKISTPIEIFKFWRNRSGEAVITSLRTHEDHNLCDLRVHFTTKQNTFAPTRNGLTISVRKLPDLLKSINLAIAKARELRLIADGETGE